jgi:hypothetical protein
MLKNLTKKPGINPIPGLLLVIAKKLSVKYRATLRTGEMINPPCIPLLDQNHSVIHRFKELD